MADFRKIVCDLINAHQYKRIAEIGCGSGQLSKMIIRKCVPDLLVLVDPLNDTGKRKSTLDKLANEIDSWGYTFYRMTSPQALKNVGNQELDFIFVHSIDDKELWLPKIRKGGMIAGELSDKHYHNNIQNIWFQLV